MRVFEIPEGAKTTKGRAIQNLINIDPDDKVTAFINTKDLKDEDYINNNFIILATKGGTIKKTTLESYSRPRQNGIKAIKIKEGDELIEARLTNGSNEVILAKRSGRAIRFNESKVRSMGRNASGVRGVVLEGKNDEVIGMICIENNEKTILVVSERGYGKRSQIDDYRITNRGGKGVKTINITEKTGNLIAIKDVSNNDHLMIINKSGIAIRMGMEDVRVMGRATQGVRLIKIEDGDEIAAVAKIELEEGEAEEDFSNGNEEGTLEQEEQDNSTDQEDNN